MFGVKYCTRLKSTEYGFSYNALDNRDGSIGLAMSVGGK